MSESFLDGKPPYKAGKYARITPAPDLPESGRCTSGYVWISVQPDGLEYLGSTAGHCLHNGDKFYLGTKNRTLYGAGYLNQFDGNRIVFADVAFVRGTPATNPTPPLIWQNSKQAQLLVTGQREAVVGEFVRMTGSTTFRGSQGYVSQTNRSGRNQEGSVVYTGIDCASYGSSAGDSGAPVYQTGLPRQGVLTATAIGMDTTQQLDKDHHATGSC